jgi:LSD1 subclass zinc finger protein
MTVVCHSCKATYIFPRGDEPVGTGECPVCKVVRSGNGRLLKYILPAVADAG